MTTHALRYRLVYIILIALVSGYVLVIFVRPVEQPFGPKSIRFSLGINQTSVARFMDMVNGRAYKPFAYRALLPSTVRFLSSATPASFRLGLTDFVENHYFTKKVFEKLGWEMYAAYPYLLACVLMWLSYIGFAHFSSKLIILTCKIQETFFWRSALAVLALLGLPPFFKYGSFVYDPPQLFLFTAALFFIASKKLISFLLIFPFACVNKETAVLLIPVSWFVWRNSCSRRKLVAILVGMVCTYVIVKGSITYVFHNNPGSFVQFHLLDHNIRAIIHGWGFTGALVWLGLLLLLSYKWQQKAYFLRVSFACILLPQVGLALFIGLLDEWRGYYEAYPIALGLITDSVLRIRTALENNTENVLIANGRKDS